MGLSPGTCEIVEPLDENVTIGQSKRSVTSGLAIDEKSGKRPLRHKYSIEDDLDQLFKTIGIRSAARRVGTIKGSAKDLPRNDSLKRPIRIGVSNTSTFGISESLSLKQALRGLCITHASEMAAMKRSSKPPGLLGASEAGALQRLYRAVVIDVRESGLSFHEGKGSSMEISLGSSKATLNNTNKVSASLKVPQREGTSSAAQSSRFDVATAAKVLKDKTPQQDETDSMAAEFTREMPTVDLEQKGNQKSASGLSPIKKSLEIDEIVPALREIESDSSMPVPVKNVDLHSSSDLRSTATDNEVSRSACNSPLVFKPLARNIFFFKKKAKKDSTLASNFSNMEEREVNPLSKTIRMVFTKEKINQKKVKKESPVRANRNASLTTGDFVSNKNLGSSNQGSQSLDRITEADVSEISRSTEFGEISQSSKSVVADYSCSTSISEESSIPGSAFGVYRPHMSKDLRWDAIRRVEMQHGSLGLRHFKLLKQLGCGDVGTVYLAELIGTSCLFAVKVMDIEFLACRNKTTRAQTEREILQMLDHPFLPTLFAHFTTNKFSCLVMDYCPAGDLHILRQRQPGRCFSEQAARFYVAEVLLALEYLHMLGVVYRDLKPENILIREDGHIMLTDFDLSLRCNVSPTLLKSSLSIVVPKKVSGPCMESSCIDPLCIQPSCVQVPCFTPRTVSAVAKTRKQKSVTGTQVTHLPQLVAEPTNARSNSFVGTHEYLAPEILKGEVHGNAVDWWTFGIFLYELLFGRSPFKGLGNEDTLANVVLQALKFPESPTISIQARDLIRALLIKDPENRLGSLKGATEIRQHPFFEGLNWALIRCTVPPKLPNSCDPRACLSTSQDSKGAAVHTTGEQLQFQLF
ncbi:hypothetical protein Sjap_001228 [Stephania japonica]|uniref:non-specific serine/threonine protein kinase n=1 Tax=Stephania japonica TaxID=461633 RepID=A0AAP0KJJ8_9MAGN